jgi:hypothetical protein
VLLVICNKVLDGYRVEKEARPLVRSHGGGLVESKERTGRNAFGL